MCVYLQGLSLVLSEGGLRDKEEKEPPMEEDVGEADALQGYQWLLRDLPRLPLFDSVRTTTALALQQVWTGLDQPWEEGVVCTLPQDPSQTSVHPPQAIHMETDPQTISAYLIYLSQHTPVEEQGPHSDLALVREFCQAQMAVSPTLWLAVGLVTKSQGGRATGDQNL